MGHSLGGSLAIQVADARPGVYVVAFNPFAYAGGSVPNAAEHLEIHLNGGDEMLSGAFITRYGGAVHMWETAGEDKHSIMSFLEGDARCARFGPGSHAQRACILSENGAFVAEEDEPSGVWTTAQEGLRWAWELFEQAVYCYWPAVGLMLL
jgi:hypothetical protein